MQAHRQICQTSSCRTGQRLETKRHGWNTVINHRGQAETARKVTKPIHSHGMPISDTNRTGHSIGYNKKKQTTYIMSSGCLRNFEILASQARPSFARSKPSLLPTMCQCTWAMHSEHKGQPSVACEAASIPAQENLSVWLNLINLGYWVTRLSAQTKHFVSRIFSNKCRSDMWNPFRTVYRIIDDPTMYQLQFQ